MCTVDLALPGTRTLSQKLFDSMLSMDIIPLRPSSLEGFAAIVGGKVEISATGPISLSNWNSFNGSLTWPFGKANPRFPNCTSPLSPVSFVSLGCMDAESLFEAGPSILALIRARKNALYKAGVW